MNETTISEDKYRKLPVVMILIASLAGIILLFNAFKLPSYYLFYKHLETKYPEKAFQIDWVQYDFLYNKFYSKALCTDDGTTFYMRIQGKDVAEDYWETSFGNKINQEIMRCIEKSAEHKYVREITADNKLEEYKSIEDFKKAPNRFYMDIEGQTIKSPEEMANVVAGIIKTLTENEFHISGLFTYAEINNEVYSLNMENRDIGKSTDDIVKLIEKVRK